MRWKQSRRSQNVEDRRGRRMGGIVGGGIGAIVIALVAMFLGVDPSSIPQVDTSSPAPSAEPGAPDEARDFVAAVLGETEDVWRGVFQQAGYTYEEPRLVLFSDAVASACGMAGSAVGPFYCPADRQVYLDLSFFHELERRFGAPGDFARAYVIAHEVGHHVQTLLGVSEEVQRRKRGAREAEANELSVRMELQADCFAGLWAHRADNANQILEAGDVEEALGAASAIGDDNLQRQAQGHVVPETFTHGSSAQRVRWFRRGLETGDVNACDTFAANEL